MTDQHASPTENENVMDYSEHERTYGMFMVGAKWASIICIAILIGMAFGFFAGFGLIGGALMFLIVVVASKFIL